VGPDGMHPQMLWELADVITRPLLTVFEESRRMGEVRGDWKAYATPIFKKGKKQDPRNSSPVSLTLIHGKVIKQLTQAHEQQKNQQE